MRAVDGVSFDLYPGATLGVVGESGCGKSITARSILRIVDRPGRIVDGEIYFRRPGANGGAAEMVDLAKLEPNSLEMRSIRGAEIALIFQEPMSSFSPVHSVGNQIIEAIRLHQPVGRREAREKTIEILRRVGVSTPEQRVDQLANQLSGGLRQRAMIAMALSCEPTLLIADEPTTALDVTTQTQILELMRQLQQEDGMAIMLITHDLGVVAEMATDVVVMYLGRVVEQGPVDSIFHAPRHPVHARTAALDPPDPRAHARAVAADRRRRAPSLRPAEWLPLPSPLHGVHGRALRSTGAGAEVGGRSPRGELLPLRMNAAAVPLLKVTGLQKLFPIKKGFLKRTVGHVRAVDGVDFHIDEGETLGLVGESGCGKTTTARCVLRAIEPTQGQIQMRVADGSVVDLGQVSPRELRTLRRQMQMIFQDPFTSLNPRMTLLDLVGEPLLVHGLANRREREEQVADLLTRVGLRPEYMRRFPHAFSGGERQRIGIARALALHPRLVVADEPVSALDVSVQAQILNLLVDLQADFGLTYLFVAHDLSVVRHISNRVAVMYVGRMVELAETTEIFDSPKHPYTAALLSAVPEPDPRVRSRRIVLQGEVANPASPPSGCYFHPRCPHAIDVCRTQTPAWQEVSRNHFVSCHRAQELQLAGVE